MVLTARTKQVCPLSERPTKRRSLQIPFVERLIYYILIPDLCARVVSEAWLGYPPNGVLQQRLWIFYGLIGVEYLFQIRIILYSRFYIDKSMYTSWFMLILVLHGLCLGISWHNDLAKISTDTIPLLVAAINILLACQIDGYKDFNFTRLEAINIIFAIIMVAVGIVAVRAGRPSVVSLGGAESTTVSMSIMAVSFWRRQVFGINFVLVNLAVLLIVAPALNRSTLAFVIIVFIILLFKNLVKSPFKLYLSIVLIGGIAVCAPLIVPPDSPLARRIQGLSSEDLAQQEKTGTGSVGDRDEEWAAIQQKIYQKGQIAKIFGLGHGAVYVIVIDQVPSTNYSNAHYGWALFYLRYGYCGFFYLFIFATLIVANMFRNINSTENFNRFVLVTCIGALIYIVTYMPFNILLAGLQFMHKRASGHKVSQSLKSLAPVHDSQIAVG